MRPRCAGIITINKTVTGHYCPRYLLERPLGETCTSATEALVEAQRTSRGPWKRSSRRSMVAKFPPLVSVGWLAARLPAVKVIDASWYLPAMGRDARGEYATQRIPGARFFDLDDTDDTSGLPHMLPSTEHFAQCMSSLGVRTGDHVICYDGKGIFSAPRLWWMLRANGHPEASVLDGGLPAWVAEGHPVDQSPPPPPLEGKPSEFAASLQPGAVWTMAQIQENLQAAPGRRSLVVDARPAARFEGTAAE